MPDKKGAFIFLYIEHTIWAQGWKEQEAFHWERLHEYSSSVSWLCLLQLPLEVFTNLQESTEHLSSHATWCP